MLFNYSMCGLECQSYSGRYMLMGNLGGYVRSIQVGQKKEVEAVIGLGQLKEQYGNKLVPANETR